MSEGESKRRNNQRYELKMDVRISTIDSETESTSGRKYFRTSEETCANVSRGGAFVLTSDPVAPGRRVLVELQLPDGPSVQAIGRVAWSKIAMGPSGPLDESGIGVQFIGGEAVQLRALDEYLTRSARSLQKGKTVEPEKSPRRA